MNKNGVQNSSMLYRVMHYKTQGMPIMVYLALAIPVIIGMVSGSLGTDLLSTIGMLFVIGVFFMELGRRLPIWNTWIGGAGMMAIMAPSFMVYMKWLPEKYVGSAKMLFTEFNFLNMYIIVLMTGALLSVNRVHLIKTLKRCGPVFLAAAVCATGFGLLGGKMVGMSMGETLSYFILPNLGGGNGAGAVPMADIFNQITGTPAKDYYAKALAILTLGSTIALIFGVVLNRIGQMIPGLAGDGKTLLRDSTKETKLEGAGEVEYEPSRLDIANAFLVAASFYTVANILGKWLLPNIGGVIIHPLAYLIVLLTLANVFNIVPENLQAASNVLGDFVVEKMAPFCFAGLGIAVTDFSEFVAAITFQNFFVCFMIILGVVIGSGIIAQLVGFYPIDAIIAAGLTCSNRGDSADVILLSATGRMGLMPYAQVMSRLGGAVILALSSVVFTIFYA